jgi:glycosyltransferase involved in cell wall biosynthesis
MVDFTGIVVTCNDVTHLEECLKRLQFCCEIVVIDLGSTDGSVELAQHMGARVVHHERVPVVEMVRTFAVEQSRTEWVVFLDPDLMFPGGLEVEIQQLIVENSDVGIISIPYQNYFMGKPLRHGRWGGCNSAYSAVLHRQRVTFDGSVHRGIQIKPGFTTMRANTDDDYIVHYWADTWQVLIKKARRYLDHEGKARYDNGERTSWMRVLIEPVRAFFYSFVVIKGVLDGLVGLQLSVFWSWYSYRAKLGLLKYTRENEK